MKKVIATTHPVARSPKTCTRCRGTIDSGTRYTRQSVLVDGKMTAEATHFSKCPEQKPPNEGGPGLCCCGENSGSRVFVHRLDGPCYVRERYIRNEEQVNPPPPEVEKITQAAPLRGKRKVPFDAEHFQKYGLGEMPEPEPPSPQEPRKERHLSFLLFMIFLTLAIVTHRHLHKDPAPTFVPVPVPNPRLYPVDPVPLFPLKVDLERPESPAQIWVIQVQEPRRVTGTRDGVPITWEE